MLCCTRASAPPESTGLAPGLQCSPPPTSTPPPAASLAAGRREAGRGQSGAASRSSCRQGCSLAAPSPLSWSGSSISAGERQGGTKEGQHSLTLLPTYTVYVLREFVQQQTVFQVTQPHHKKVNR